MLIENTQARFQCLSIRGIGEHGSDVQARFRLLHGEFSGAESRREAVLRLIRRAEARPVPRAVDMGVEGGAVFLVGLPRFAQRPGDNMPLRRILLHAVHHATGAQDIAIGRQLEAGIGERHLRFLDDVARFQFRGNRLRRAGEAQQHGALRGVTGNGIGNGLIPVAPINPGALRGGKGEDGRFCGQREHSEHEQDGARKDTHHNHDSLKKN
ncbi:MAG: hypothetical protein BWY76_03176 [bacterium ADurb.Bin429]|nr:MAG: hypothetical protein BWY76_03176 [bacterium ADurb.Bin429]